LGKLYLYQFDFVQELLGIIDNVKNMDQPRIRNHRKGRDFHEKR
jgi:hypothetical protein